MAGMQVAEGGRELGGAGWTPETCYTACKARLNNAPSFVMNIYNLQQVCTCCTRCEGLRYVPGAQVFATCAGPASGLTVAAKAWPGKKGVRRGGKVVYALRLRNTPALQGLGVRVVLPPGVTVVGTHVRSAIKGGPAGGKVPPVVTGSVVDWPSVPTHVKQRRVFVVVARVSPQAAVGSQLVFSGYAYQSTPVGTTFCDAFAPNVTMVVVKK